MYVYVSNKGNIVLKTEKRQTKFWGKYKEYIVDYSMTDNLIYEEYQIKKYENSKQYIEDTNRYHLNKELEETKRKKSELESIANMKVKKELELDVKWEEANEYQRKIYLLRNMRWLQQSWWQENDKNSQ